MKFYFLLLMATVFYAQVMPEINSATRALHVKSLMSLTNVFVMNKELVFERLGILECSLLGDQLSPPNQHWSIRGVNPYPKALHAPILLKRLP